MVFFYIQKTNKYSCKMKGALLMEQLKLPNGKTYALIVNGVQEGKDMIKFLFDPGLDGFETIENGFSTIKAADIIYILDSVGEPVRSIVGYSKYKGMEKQVDYVISSEMVNTGTTENPIYEESKTKGTVMIVTMSKPDLEDKINELEADVINTMLALTEIYEGGTI